MPLLWAPAMLPGLGIPPAHSRLSSLLSSPLVIGFAFPTWPWQLAFALFCSRHWLFLRHLHRQHAGVPWSESVFSVRLLALSKIKDCTSFFLVLNRHLPRVGRHHYWCPSDGSFFNTVIVFPTFADIHGLISAWFWWTASLVFCHWEN